MNMQCDNIIAERRPDIVIVTKMEKTEIFIDVAIPKDRRIIDKEKEMIEKYHNLKGQIPRLWNLKKIDVRTAVLRAIGKCYKEL